MRPRGRAAQSSPESRRRHSKSVFVSWGSAVDAWPKVNGFVNGVCVPSAIASLRGCGRALPEAIRRRRRFAHAGKARGERPRAGERAGVDVVDRAGIRCHHVEIAADEQRARAPPAWSAIVFTFFPVKSSTVMVFASNDDTNTLARRRNRHHRADRARQFVEVAVTVRVAAVGTTTDTAATERRRDPTLSIHGTRDETKTLRPPSGRVDACRMQR